MPENRAWEISRDATVSRRVVFRPVVIFTVSSVSFFQDDRQKTFQGDMPSKRNATAKIMLRHFKLRHHRDMDGVLICGIRIYVTGIKGEEGALVFGCLSLFEASAAFN
jgi:hypothetical protein